MLALKPSETISMGPSLRTTVGRLRELLCVPGALSIPGLLERLSPYSTVSQWTRPMLAQGSLFIYQRGLKEEQGAKSGGTWEEIVGHSSKQHLGLF